MGMTNGKSIRNAIKQFVKDHGRQPTFEEARDMISGRMRKKESK